MRDWRRMPAGEEETRPIRTDLKHAWPTPEEREIEKEKERDKGRGKGG